MNTTTPTEIRHQHQPKLPEVFSKPAQLLPEMFHTTLIVKVLNVMLAQAVSNGELAFLAHKQVSVEVLDLKLRFALSLSRGRLQPRRWRSSDDLNISGSLYDFLLLASRQEDSDALFFHRRLKMEGSTDLGLEVKNLLDGMDTDQIRFHKQLDFMLHRGIRIFEKVFK